MDNRCKRRLFLKSPRAGVSVSAYTYYTRREGLALTRVDGHSTRSDTTDMLFRRHSQDNGATWSEPEEIATNWPVPGGTFRRSLSPGFVDPETGALLFLSNQGVLPSDNPLEGMKNWTLHYCVSLDGGHSMAVEDPVIEEGAEYDESHPLRGVWRGKNSVMLGDTTMVPIRTRAGKILIPVQITPIGPDGEYHNPGGGFTYHYSAVLIGTWSSDHRISWDLSEAVEGDPARSTRGMLEPTIAEMPDGRILMVLRGSNDRRPELPGFRWWSVSEDGGRQWSAPEPWRYSDGEPFFSPSSCSQLIRHSGGRYFWIGNICNDNPVGNRPRYPLVIGEVNPNNLALERESLCVLDDRSPADHVNLTLSNFYAREDRVTGEIVIHCTRFFAGGEWDGDAYEYRFKP
ncbi:MAG: sialidase family protein [Limnochordia bacterium]|jgi:hypothetical protein